MSNQTSPASGCGQQPEAALLLVGEQLEQVAVFAPPAQLQLGLVADAPSKESALRIRRKPARQASSGARSPSASSVVMPVGDQRLGLRAPHPGDEREVVVVDALLPAHVPEVADPAVARTASRRSRARPRPRRGTARGRAGSTPRTRPPGTSRARRARSRRAPARPAGPRSARPARRRTCSCSTCAGLARARELRVDGLVAAVGLLLEEVAEPAPRPVGQVRLVDDVCRAGADRLLGQPLRLVGVEALVVVGRDPDDRAPLGLEPREVGGLVLVPLAEDEVAVRRLELRLDDLTARGGEARASSGAGRRGGSRGRTGKGSACRRGAAAYLSICDSAAASYVSSDLRDSRGRPQEANKANQRDSADVLPTVINSPNTPGWEPGGLALRRSQPPVNRRSTSSSSGSAFAAVRVGGQRHVVVGAGGSEHRLRRGSRRLERRQPARVAAEEPAQRIPHARRHPTRVELPELELLVVAAHLRARLLTEAELLDERRSEIVQLQPERLPRAQERRIVEGADVGERIGRRLSSRCSLEERGRSGRASSSACGPARTRSSSTASGSSRVQRPTNSSRSCSTVTFTTRATLSDAD